MHYNLRFIKNLKFNVPFKRFEWADIYDISKARNLKWSVSLIPFYLIRQSAL